MPSWCKHLNIQACNPLHEGKLNGFSHDWVRVPSEMNRPAVVAGCTRLKGQEKDRQHRDIGSPAGKTLLYPKSILSLPVVAMPEPILGILITRVSSDDIFWNIVHFAFAH